MTPITHDDASRRGARVSASLWWRDDLADGDDLSRDCYYAQSPASHCHALGRSADQLTDDVRVPALGEPAPNDNAGADRPVGPDSSRIGVWHGDLQGPM